MSLTTSTPAMTHTLKLKGEPVVPGLALPEAFQSLEGRVDATLELCRLNSSPESQILGLVTVCQEMKHLLKCAFVENGMLATRIEILTRYHSDSMRKLEKRLEQADVENKVTRKHVKRLRKRLSSLESIQSKKGELWWNINVQTTDYDTISLLSRSSGEPDLEFMLRVNQLMIDFVGDKEKTELILPPMGAEERQEVAKLASVYKLRCRYGKAVQIATSTLLKARQAYMPAPGEVDAILESFTKQQKKMLEGEESKDLSAVTDAAPLSTELSSSMLTPLSTLSSPTIDLVLPPPGAIVTPKLPSQQKKDAGAEDPPGESPADGDVQPNEKPVLSTAKTKSDQSTSSNDSPQRTTTSDPPPHVPSSVPPPGPGLKTLGGPPHTRHVGQPMVLASPIKLPTAAAPLLTSHSSATPSDATKREGGGASKREGGGNSPAPKRLRLTRRSVEDDKS